MASAELSRRVGKVVAYPPLSEMDERQRREFQGAPLDADSFEDLPGKWQAAILEAEQNRPKLRLVSSDRCPRYRGLLRCPLVAALRDPAGGSRALAA